MKRPFFRKDVRRIEAQENKKKDPPEERLEELLKATQYAYREFNLVTYNHRVVCISSAAMVDTARRFCECIAVDVTSDRNDSALRLLMITVVDNFWKSRVVFMGYVESECTELFVTCLAKFRVSLIFGLTQSV